MILSRNDNNAVHYLTNHSIAHIILCGLSLERAFVYGPVLPPRLTTSSISNVTCDQCISELKYIVSVFSKELV